jgi:hypothetical protein
MKKFMNTLLSDSNKVSTKRFIGLLSLIMFMAYGIKGLVIPFNLNFWVFYITLCSIMIWIAFKFMTAEKILKYDVVSKLNKFSQVKEIVEEFVENETTVDDVIQPDMNPVENNPEIVR